MVTFIEGLFDCQAVWLWKSTYISSHQKLYSVGKEMQWQCWLTKRHRAQKSDFVHALHNAKYVCGVWPQSNMSLVIVFSQGYHDRYEWDTGLIKSTMEKRKSLVGCIPLPLGCPCLFWGLTSRLQMLYVCAFLMPNVRIDGWTVWKKNMPSPQC